MHPVLITYTSNEGIAQHGPANAGVISTEYVQNRVDNHVP